jgi:DNA primase catalytic core
MGFSPGFLDELRRRISVFDLISRGGVKLVRRRAREFAGLCPFHREKTPSFYVVEDKRFFHCFGCGAHGDAIAFVMRAEGLDFRAAVTKLADEAGLAVPASPLAPTACTSKPNHEQSSVLNGARRRPRQESDAEAIAAAQRIWDAGADAHGTDVEIYLASRGLVLPPLPVLRWASSCR